MQYLNYEEYRSLGGELSETAFNRIVDRVNGIINNATHGRIEKMQTVPVQAKALARDLIEYCVSNPVAGSNITSKSQSAGNVSESESYTVKTNEEQAADIDNMIFDYLMSVKDDNGTPLLYRGCAD